jgi:hypothetical protein
MDDWRRGSRAACALLITVFAWLCVAACGGSSNDSASTLLKQTFSGSHAVKSGNLRLSLTITPSGSSTLTTPISLTFGGPFQSMGAGKLPKSNFSVSLSSAGKTGSLGLLSTGAAGYVTLQGTSYQLPAATFQKLESSFAGLASSPSNSSGSGTLAKLGIRPLDWLTRPSVVGNDSVGGTQTTHIHAAVNVSSLLGDIDTFLQKATSVGVSGASKLPTSISPTTRARIAGEVQNPAFDVWTGKSDKTVRRMTIRVTLPVAGQLSTELGGMRSAQIGLTMQYTNLNQPQTISAPTTVRPYTEFTSKLRTFLTAIEGGLAGTGATNPTAPSTGSGSGTGSSGTTTRVEKYSQCIASAHGDVGKMQKCASLINGG